MSDHYSGCRQCILPGFMGFLVLEIKKAKESAFDTAPKLV